MASLISLFLFFRQTSSTVVPLFSAPNTHALSIPISSRSLSTIESQLTISHNSTYLSQTLWSCLFTIIAAAWLSVHPNLPRPDDSRWMREWRRLKVVLWALLMPEISLYWSVRQWNGARKLREDYQAYDWTLKHAHFLQMGGFLVTSFSPNGDERQEIMSPLLLSQLLERRIVDLKLLMPSFSSLDSQGSLDPLLSLVVLLQILWFVLQCIGRAAEGLPVLQLEVVTLAYLVMDAMMLWFWWEKPMGTVTHINFILPQRNRDKPEVDIKVQNAAPIRDDGIRSNSLGIGEVAGRDIGQEVPPFSHKSTKTLTRKSVRDGHNTDSYPPLIASTSRLDSYPIVSLAVDTHEWSSPPSAKSGLNTSNALGRKEATVLPILYAPNPDLLRQDDDVVQPMVLSPYPETSALPNLGTSRPSRRHSWDLGQPNRARIVTFTSPGTRTNNFLPPNGLFSNSSGATSLKHRSPTANATSHSSARAAASVSDRPPLRTEILEPIASSSAEIEEVLREEVQITHVDHALHTPTSTTVTRETDQNPPFQLGEDDADCHRNNRRRQRPGRYNETEPIVLPFFWTRASESPFSRHTTLDRVLHFAEKMMGLADVDNQLMTPPQHASHVPSFYAWRSEPLYNLEDMRIKSIVGALSVVFGAIHLIAWNFPFPSYAQMLVWRISSLILVGVPPLAALGAFGLSGREAGEQNWGNVMFWALIEATIYPLTLLYIPARVALHILPILELTAKAAQGFDIDGLRWSKFLPHFR